MRALKQSTFLENQQKVEKFNASEAKQHQKHNPQVEKALENLKKKAPLGWGVSWNDEQTGIETLSGDIPWAKATKLNDSGEKIATDFLKENHELFQLRSDLADLHFERVLKQFAGYIINLRQTFNGLPVFNGSIRMSITQNDKYHTIDLIHNYYVPDINISTTPSLSENDVIAIAKDDVLQNRLYITEKDGEKTPYTGQVVYDARPPQPKLGIFIFKNRPILVYRFSLFVRQPLKMLSYTIDANTGEIIESIYTMKDAAPGKGQSSRAGTLFCPPFVCDSMLGKRCAT